MPKVVGIRHDNEAGRGYLREPIAKYAAAYNDCVKSILNESGIDVYQEGAKALRYSSSNEALKNFFVENTIDEDAIRAIDGSFADESIQEEYEALGEQYTNDREQVLSEYANLGSFNPIVGMTFPLHKWILMNNIFDKGAIPKVVAREPKFTITMETRWLVTPDGEKIDMFKEQYRMTDAINATVPSEDIELNLPEEGQTDLISQIAGSRPTDHLSIDSNITAVKTSVYLKTGDINPETNEVVASDGEVEVWYPVDMRFVPSYGEYNRTITAGVDVPTRDPSNPDNKTFKHVVISGFIKDDKIALNTFKNAASAVRFHAKIDTSTAMVDTCSVMWDTTTTVVEIPESAPINTTISPEEVKDTAALYDVSQLTKIISMMKLTLGNYKDDMIKKHLDESFIRMPETDKVQTAFDFAPRVSYAFSHVEWRKETFMDYLDHVTTIMLQVLNDPNMTISVIGSPELVRMITPTTYQYQAPSNFGPVDLDFSRTIVTSDKRVYQFIGSDKLRDTTNFILLLAPRNSERIIYRIYDYQMYISNEIRNKRDYTHPAIHAFERWKFVEYQPVQGRIKILHPSGLEQNQVNDEPIQQAGRRDMNIIL